MAERVEKPTPDTSAAASAAEDLSVLFPDQTIELMGKNVTVIEYRFIQWLKLKAKCSDLIEIFAEFLKAKEVDLNDILECFEDHFDLIQDLIVEATSLPQDFLEQLGDEDMQALLLTWWSVNKHFFLRSADRLLRKKQKTQSDIATSSSN